jgi:translocation and assembly module TamB
MLTRQIARLSLALMALVAVAIVLSLVIVNTEAFHDFLRAEISRQALQRLGARVEVGPLYIHWSRLAVGVSDVSVFRGDYEHTPVASVKRLEVRVRFLPLLSGRLELNSLILDEPILRIVVDATGTSNLPKPPPRASDGGSPLDSIFNLRVGNCAIQSGEIAYNDVVVPLDADLRNVQFEASHALVRNEYQGSLSYEHASLAGRAFILGDHSVQLQFVVAKSGLTVKRIVLLTSGSRMEAAAKLSNYASPSIEGQFQANISTDDLARVLREARISSGMVQMDGNFSYARRAKMPFLSSVQMQGRMTSDRLSFALAQRPVDIRAISATYELKSDDLTVDKIMAVVLGARARGTFSMRGLSAPVPLAAADLSIQGLSLQNASSALAPPDVQRIRLAGIADLNVRASWPSEVRAATARARLSIATPPARGPQNLRTGVIPIAGLVQASYDGPQDVLTFANSYIQTASTKVSLGGTLAPRGSSSQIALAATTQDLREVGDLFGMIEGALHPSSQRASMPQLSGAAAFSAAISGTANNPRIAGRLSAHDFSVGSTHWRSVNASVNADSNHISASNVTLTGPGQQEIKLSGSAGLRRWYFVATSPLSVETSVSNLPVSEIEQLANLRYPLSGLLAARVSVNGTRADLNGKASITMTSGSAFSLPINKLNVEATSSGGTIGSTINLDTAAGAAVANVMYSLSAQSYDIHASSDSIKLDKIAAIQHRLPISGVAALVASGRGTLNDPQMQANLRVAQLQIAGHSFSGVGAQLQIANQRVDVSINSSVDQGELQAKGSVELAGAQDATAEVDLTQLSIATLATAISPSAGSKLEGHADLHATLRGPIKNPEQMSAHLEVPSFNVAYGKAQLSLVRPLVADYKSGLLTVTPSQIRGTGTNLTFGGTLAVSGGAVYALNADGTVDLGVVQQFAPNVRSSGQVEVHLESRGSPSQPNVQGKLQLKNAVFATDSSPVGIEGLNAQININGARADIVNFAGTVGGGNLSAHGFGYIGKQPSFDLALTMSSVRVRYPEGLRSVWSGQLNLEGAPNRSTLSGRVLVNGMSFSQEFDLANFASHFSEDSSGTQPSAFENGMRLAVAVQSSQDLNLASNKLSIGGSANLNLTGTLADPVVLGRIALNSGEVFFLGKRFQVQSGTIAFANPVRTEPVLRLFVTAVIERYNVTLNLNGPADRLRTNYTSEPALPPADIIHLLAFGNTTAEAASAPAQSASLGAESVLAQGVSGQVAGKVENLTGISQLSIDPLATNAQGDPGATVAIQQRVTGSLLFTFSTNVTETQDQTVELQYDVSRRFSVTILRDQNGGYGIDLRFHKVF